VVGLDNFNGYYDPQLKHDRVQWVREQVGHFQLARIDLADAAAIEALFVREQPQVVIHLAAQAGCVTRWTIPRPIWTATSTAFNILEPAGTTGRALDLRLIEFGVRRQPAHAVLGAGRRQSPAVAVRRDQKANELMAHSYSHLFGIPSTGLRFFTVYGPWGGRTCRPSSLPGRSAKARR
jgi:UDP-glucuronate 4-epimerase